MTAAITRNALLILIGLMIRTSLVYSQEIDLENIRKRTKETLKKKKPVKVNGGFSANGIYYDSDVRRSRSPFVWFFNGNIHVLLYQWDFPLTVSLTNQDSKLGYKIPYTFDRISLHPKYKWIQAHIGTAAMSFSPYTYNGWMFTGAGLELTPDNPVKVAMFVGRLNKAVEDDGNPQTIPAFKRSGYGIHLKHEKETFKTGLIVFYAKDDIASLKKNIPESKNVKPQENLVLSLIGKLKILKNVELFGEMANSILTTDIRASPRIGSRNPANLIIPEKTSTTSYSAYNTGINIAFGKSSLGVRYERIEPDYRTLGAYFFNNDLENITVNTAHALFQGKLSLAVNLGRQNDNIHNQKRNQTGRWVSSLNISCKASERLNITASYSNFTSFTNTGLNQFNKINQNPLSVPQPRDTIVYKQLSQNATLNLLYLLSERKDLTQNMSFGYSLNTAVNKENNRIRTGGLSEFHNFNLNHTLGITGIHTSITTSLNYTHVYTASRTTRITGPAITVNGTLPKNKLNANIGGAYSSTASGNTRNRVMNFRAGLNFIPLKNHTLSLNLIRLFQTADTPKQTQINELTISLNYSCNF